MVASFYLASAAPGCTRGADDDWLVRGGGLRIGVEDYMQRLRWAQKDLGDIPILNRQEMLQVHQRLLGQLISEYLLVAEAERRGIRIAEAQVTAEMSRLRVELGDRDWQSYLLEHYVDERSWQVNLKTRLMIDALLLDELSHGRPVTEPDIASYMEDLSGNVAGQEFELNHIVVADPKTAQEIRRELLAGGDFAVLARRYSIGPERERGGNLGYVRAVDLPESFSPAFELKIGQLSDIVETEFGFHIFRWTAVRDAATKREQQPARDKIRETLQQNRMEALRAELASRLKSQARIELNQAVWSKILGD